VTASGTALPRLVLTALLLAAWQGLALSGWLFQDVIPPLQTLLGGFAAVLSSRDFYANAAITGGELLVALAAGGTAGLLVGLALGSSRFISAAFERWVNYLSPTPKIILFPVLILMFGVGIGSKMAMGSVSCFFPIAISVAAGVRGVDGALLRVGRSFRASRAQTVRKILLPAMAAPLVNGFRLGFGVALIGVLLAETKLSNQGVGFEIMEAYHRFDMPRMYALLILAVAFAATVNLLAGRVAARLGGQHRRGRPT